MSQLENTSSNLERLAPFNKDGVLQVVIETPKGSRNKYAWDHERRCFELKKVLPAGMVFPYDFGFIPSTRADDGDDLDVLLLMDEPAFPGCVLGARLIGAFEGEDTLEDGTKQRNDRLLAVAEASDLFANFNHVDDLPDEFRKHVGHFFENYPRVLSHKEFKLLRTSGPAEAMQLIEKARL
ncbi:MAG: inorganic diphosphatase [Janthinobacterium lividum]